MSVPSMGVSVHLASLRCPPILLVSGPASGAAHTLIWFFSCVFLLLMSTVVRTNALSFVRVLIVLSCIPWPQCQPSWSCGFNLKLVQLVGRFWIVFLTHPASGFQWWFYIHLCMWLVHRGFAPKAALENLSLPQWGPGGGWCSCLGHGGPGNTSYSGELEVS